MSRIAKLERSTSWMARMTITKYRLGKTKGDRVKGLGYVGEECDEAKQKNTETIGTASARSKAHKRYGR